jgi:hypothetical protein
MIPELLQSQHEAPRRKFRGRARYFRRVRRQARNFSLIPEEGQWWDVWHYHSDWTGWGNINWSIRLEHIKALAEVFRSIAKAHDAFPTPFQCWIFISGRDAGEDATYLHTPNGNGTEFPVRLNEVDWSDERLLPVFEDLIPEYTLRVGRSSLFDEYAEPPRDTSSFFIYSPEIGIPLQK